MNHSLKIRYIKSKELLILVPTWTIDRALDMIVDWHEALDNNLNMRAFSIDQINYLRRK